MLDYKKWQELVESMPEEEQTKTLNRVKNLIEIYEEVCEYNWCIANNDNVEVVMGVFYALAEEYKEIDLEYIDSNVVDKEYAKMIIDNFIAQCLDTSGIANCVVDTNLYCEMQEYDYYMCDIFEEFAETVRLITYEDLTYIIEHLLENYYNYLTNKVNTTTKNI